MQSRGFTGEILRYFSTQLHMKTLNILMKVMKNKLTPATTPAPAKYVTRALAKFQTKLVFTAVSNNRVFRHTFLRLIYLLKLIHL